MQLLIPVPSQYLCTKEKNHEDHNEKKSDHENPEFPI